MMRLLPIVLCFLTACSQQLSMGVDNSVTTEEESQYLQTDHVQLSSPQVSIDSTVFRESATVELSFALEGAEIYYRLDDEELQLYEKPLEIKETTLLQTLASKDGYQESAIESVQLLKSSSLLSDAALAMTPEPSKDYGGDGVNSLTDLMQGSVDFRKGNHWLGLLSEDIVVKIDLLQQETVQRVHLSFLSEPGAWIFLPATIDLFLDDKLSQTLILDETLETDSAETKVVSFELKESSLCKAMRLHIKNLTGLPEWHPGKGKLPWLFIDEIIVE